MSRKTRKSSGGNARRVIIAARGDARAALVAKAQEGDELEAIDTNSVKRLLWALDRIAATPPGRQSLWDCTVAGWAADVIREAQAIEARRAATGTGAVHESAVRQDAPVTPTNPQGDADT